MIQIRYPVDEPPPRLKRAGWNGTAVLVILILFSTLCHAARPGEPDETVHYLKSLTLEELAEVEVTSAAKTPQKLADSPAAVFVITGEDIRRSGAAGIPEALRMAPGVHVARINVNSWAISARGFNSFFSNKLLVMMDGRTVYSPLYSGVFWSVQDTMLEDIDRIEVIRGPGASLWGANAVNGVINIITKSSEDATGGLVVAGAGTEERGFGGVRYGARVGENAHIRAYARYVAREASAADRGIDDKDDFRRALAGFRLDSRLSAVDSLTIQGDVVVRETDLHYRRHTTSPPYRELSRGKGALDGGNILARWTRAFSQA
ncbi:MAG: TonB-dependent receptor plug domain-containing protein, partial [Desulfobacterales bacterium]|nr:TonB-dependent receptor plug domain-containing protein [Desulfobacterales bacterium]